MRLLLLILCLAGSLAAQYPASATALRWVGKTSSAGPFCWGFDIKPAAATIVPGESGTLTVRGEWEQIYALGLAPTANRCVTLPIAYNCLLLDDPILILATGTCDEPSPILACPGGLDSLPIKIPRGMPRGVSFTIQAVVSVPAAAGMPRYAFTQAITFTVL